ncbi:MAG: hypothetical protein K2X47_10260 [Bdellovibrionales bacterium]|nr:hypothetical protein [Bdellovibrionales bacterium]
MRISGKLRSSVFLFLTLMPLMAHAQMISWTNIQEKHIQEVRKKIPSLNEKKATQEDLDAALRILYATESYEHLELFDHEGARFEIRGASPRTVGDVQIVGNTRLPREDILGTLGLRVGDRLVFNDLQEGAEKLKDRYGELGFANTEVSIDFERKQDQAFLVKVKVQEGFQTLISDIKVDTESPSLIEDLKKNLDPKKGQPLKQEILTELSRLIQEVLIEKKYLIADVRGPEVKITPDGKSASVTFHISKPYRFYLQFDGRSQITESDLNKELGIHADSNLGLNYLSELRGRVEAAYRRRGFNAVTVDSSEKLMPQDYARSVTLKISEGERTKIKMIEFAGVMSRPSKYYEELLLEKGSELIKNRFYHRDDLNNALNQMIIELQNQGYLRAKVQSSRSDFGDQRKTVNVLVQLDEGPLTVVQEVKLTGHLGLPEKVIFEKLSLRPGTPLLLNRLDQALDDLKTFYNSQGFLDMTILNEKEKIIQYNTSGTEAVVNIEIEAGPKVVVAAIVVEGLEATKESVVRRELAFSPGETLTPDGIRDSQAALQRLGIFSSTEVVTVESGTPIAERTVIVRVRERDAGVFSTGFGANTEFDFTVRGYMGLAYRNLGGRARQLITRFEAQKNKVNYFDNQFSVGYFEPYLFAQRTRGRVNFLRSRSLVNIYRGDNQIQEVDQLEFLIEKDFSRNAKLIWNLYTIAKINDASGFRLPFRGEIASIGPIFELDYRDNMFNAKSGTFSRIAIEYAAPWLGSSLDRDPFRDDPVKSADPKYKHPKYHKVIDYIRATAGINHYWPFFNKRLGWANSLRGVYVSKIHDE